MKSVIINTTLIVFAALFILAFTITDIFSGKDSKLGIDNAGVKDSAGSLFSTAAASTNPPHGKPGHRHELPVGAPLTNNTGLATQTANKFLPNATVQPQNIDLNKNVASTAMPAASGPLNPAHGKPGHRCDIAVGAPLNSAPANAPTNAAPVAKANIASNAKGLNPAHGQPGHRCDIAVGAPLNSAPAKPATAKPQSITATTASTVPTGKNINPAHGQPGHRCDIAVGAPLDSKPAAPKTDPSKLYPFPPSPDSSKS